MDRVEPPSFGSLLRRFRFAANLTQEGLAERAGMSARGVQDLERGVRHPYPDTVRRLAAGLRLSPDERTTLTAVAQPQPQPKLSSGKARGAREPRARDYPLPVALTSFVGREAEMAEARRLLAVTRLLTIVGPPGAGKTRLALEIAARVAAEDRQDVCFVPLATVAGHDLVASAIAQRLGIREPAGEPALAALQRELRDRQIVLVLDNFEHVLAAGPLVGDLLRACPRVKVVATSRALLRVHGEQSFSLPPLRLPGGRPARSLEQLADAEAVRLFLDRARAAVPGFTLTRENAASVEEICRRLDGLPLAIELAAARLRLLSPGTLLARLEPRLRFLIGGPRDLSSRHQTLRDAIAWSYDLLDAGEQALFRLLAVFVGGCTLETAEAASGAFEDPAGPGLDGLTSLADKSLVERGVEDGGEPRFRMLETIREFALERLAESGEAPGAGRWHATYFLGLAEQAEANLWGPEQAGWLGQLDRELPNLHAALRWSVDHAAVDHALRLMGPLSSYWMLRGHLAEGRELLAALLASPPITAPTSERARVLDAIGCLAFYQRDYGAARPVQEESLAIRRALGDKGGMVGSLAALGATVRQQGEPATARATYDESLALCRELGFAPGVANSLHGLAEIAHEERDYAAARALHEQALALCRDMRFGVGVAIHLHQLGLLAEDVLEFGEARARFEECLAIRRELGDRRGEAQTLLHLGSVAVARRDFAEAESSLAAALRIQRELGDLGAAALVLQRFATLAAAQGRAERAMRLAGAAAGLRDPTRAALPAEAQLQLERDLAPARQALGVDEASAAWERGRALDPERAIADALGGDR